MTRFIIAMTILTTTLAHGGECKSTVDANGEKHGEVRCYNAKGVLTDLQTWKHGKWHGPWKYWTDDGRLYKEEAYDEQRQHGRYRDWDSTTGFPKSEGQYAHGQKVGEWRQYFDAAPGGRLYYVTVYAQDGQEIGDRMYSNDGHMTQSTKRDLKAGVVVQEFFHDNGKLRERSESREKGQTFERRSYDETGKLTRIERMAENQSHGLQEQIADNGHREVECYVKGQRQDSLAPCGGKAKIAADGSETIRRTWEDGKPREEFRLVQGERDGDYKSFDRKGRVVATVVYKKGVAVSGRSVDFDEDGKIATEREFADGKSTLERAFYQNGKVREEQLRQKDDRWILKTYYDTGKLEREVPFVPGGHWYGRSYEGVEKVYDSEGRLAEETEYRNGRRHGRSKRLHEGKLFAKATYQDGNLLSETYYDEQGRVVASTEYHKDGSRK